MVRSLRHLLVALAAYALTLPAFAQTTPVVVSPYSVTVQSVEGTGLRSLATYEATAAQSAANARFYTRAVTFSEQTIANGARTRVALGGAVAISAAMLATGYLLDQLTGQITTPANPTGSTGDFATHWCAGSNYPSSSCMSGGPATTPQVAAENWARYQGRWGSPYCTQFTFVYYTGSPGYYGATPKNDSGGSCFLTAFSVWYALKPGYSHPTTDPKTSPQPAGPATDPQVALVLRNNPNTWPEITHNPNGTPRVLNPMPTQMQQVQDQYRQDTGLTPRPAGEAEPIPAPSAVPDSGSAPNPNTEPVAPGSTAPPPSGGGSSFTLPSFCTWAKYVCDFVDWVKTEPPTTDPDAPELPTAEVSQMEDYQSGLGNGSCPADGNVTIAGRAYAFSYSSVCDLAAGGRIFVLISATLLAGFMLMKVFT